MSDLCLYCPRICPRCNYEIDPGWEHIEQPQAPGSNVAVCELRRVVRPLLENLSIYLEHCQNHASPIRREAKG